MFLQLHNKKKKIKQDQSALLKTLERGLGLDEAKKAAGKRSDS